MNFRSVATLAKSTFLLLVRDKVFIPAIVIGLIFVLTAIMISDWSVEDFVFIVFQIIAFGYHITGGVVAMIWGSKIISESKMQGAIESQLATPISRSTWLVGNYLGLSITLVILWSLMLVLSQGVMLFYKYGWMSESQYSCLILIGILWQVIAAFAFLFGSFCGSAITLFGTIGTWIAGISVGIALTSITPRTNPIMATAIQFVAKFFDLSRLNLSNFLYDGGVIARSQFVLHGLYGVFLTVILLVITCIIFEKKDLI